VTGSPRPGEGAARRSRARGSPGQQTSRPTPASLRLSGACRCLSAVPRRRRPARPCPGKHQKSGSVEAQAEGPAVNRSRANGPCQATDGDREA